MRSRSHGESGAARPRHVRRGSAHRPGAIGMLPPAVSCGFCACAAEHASPRRRVQRAAAVRVVAHRLSCWLARGSYLTEYAQCSTHVEEASSTWDVTSSRRATVVSGQPVIYWSDPRLSPAWILGPSAPHRKEAGARSAAYRSARLGGTCRVTAGVPRQVRAHGDGDGSVRRPAVHSGGRVGN